MNSLLQLSPQAFISFLQKNKIRRLHFIWNPETQRVEASHAVLQPIADFIQHDRRDFLRHEGIFLQVTRQHNTLQGAFVHNTHRGQGAGGTRFWGYQTLEEYLRDGLRLSKGMTRKNALAGLWWGGGKGVIARNPELDNNDPRIRADLFREYGELMTALRGCYVTAEDVGTDTSDMAHIFSKTRFITCIPPELGGSGNPSVPTATGVLRGMEAALAFADGGTIAGRTVAVQGMGNVGWPLIRMLIEKGARRVFACDISAARVQRAKETFSEDVLDARLITAGDNEILFSDCDIVAPCATGAVLNPQTIPRLRAKIVCGAANNQLEDSERDDLLLFERGIIYVPDFLVNRMGIVNCANEQYGYVSDDPAVTRHLDTEWEYSIYRKTIEVLQLAREEKAPPARTAIHLADRIAREPHPIFGHRGQQIIASLVAERWYEKD